MFLPFSRPTLIHHFVAFSNSVTNSTFLVGINNAKNGERPKKAKKLEAYFPLVMNYLDGSKCV